MDKNKLELNKEFAEQLVFQQMERAERHEKRTERMFWGIVALFLVFMIFAYVQPMSVDLKVDEGKNIIHQINGGSDNGGENKS